MDINPEIIERISRNIEEKGGSADKNRIISKMNLLVSEFSIPAEEAERTVTNEIIREQNLNFSGSSSGSGETVPIADANPGDWVTVEGKIVSVSTPPSPSMAQTGIISDESGAIRFVVWAKANAPLMEELKWYRIESATVDEYRGASSMKIHSGTTITEIEEDRPLMPEPVPISDLKPGVGTIRAKVIQNWEPRHERMFQSGMLGDETATISFISWKSENNQKLEEGKVYNIYYAGVDEYQGRLSLNITDAMPLEDENADIDVASGNVTLSGAFVHMGSNSGLIKRCPVEGCNRALNRQNFCPVHEIQNDFRYDLRITGFLDDGNKATSVLIKREEVETITGTTLEKAIEMAENNPLGFDDVLLNMQKVLVGKYLTCQGNDMDGTLLVKKCNIQEYDTTGHTNLINRAAEKTGGKE